MSEETGYDPLSHTEQLDLAVDLDNIEEALKVAQAGHPIEDAAEQYIPVLRHWVDRLCR